jgi:RNA polymerase sigma-70 factor (ECF subfamily)
MEGALSQIWLTSAKGSRLMSGMQGRGAAQTAQDLEQEVFRGLVEQHSRMVFRLAYRMTGNEQDAEDVVQEAFLKAYRHFSRFDSRATFSTWIHRIAANCAIDVLRRRRRRRKVGEDESLENFPSADPLPDSSAFGGQIQQRFALALEQLTPQERAAFVLRHFEGVSIEQIGRMLRLGSNAVKQSVFRAVQKLRRELEPLRGSLR